MIQENIINHVAFVIDSSGSMGHLRYETVKVADNLVNHLATRSREMDQETRATIYTFAEHPKCVFYDKDVLRLPSLKGKYHVGGMTALIRATIKALDDLEKTATLYGDHSFLVYVLTDGAENASHGYDAGMMRNRIDGLPSNWTVAVAVPDQMSIHEAKGFGFPADNIKVWNATSEGVTEVGETIRVATDNYMTARGSGIGFVGTRNLFTMDLSNLSDLTIRQNMRQLRVSEYEVFRVTGRFEIRKYVETMTHRPYRARSTYYQFTKTEDIRGDSPILVQRKKDAAVFEGVEARSLVGLDNFTRRVNPADHPDYDIFIQSASYNRKLVPGTRIIVRG